HAARRADRAALPPRQAAEGRGVVSGDLNITSGGAVSVDSEAFRAIGDRLSRAADTVHDAGEKARRASRLLALRPSLPGLIDPWEIGACGDRLVRIADEMREDA